MTIPSPLMPGSADAAALMRAMGHAGRLEILCLLQQGELAMSEIARRLALRGPAVSQQLAVLRGERLVIGRRQGKNVFYSIADDATRAIIEVLQQRFCPRLP